MADQPLSGHPIHTTPVPGARKPPMDDPMRDHPVHKKPPRQRNAPPPPPPPPPPGGGGGGYWGVRFFLSPALTVTAPSSTLV